MAQVHAYRVVQALPVRNLRGLELKVEAKSMVKVLEMVCLCDFSSVFGVGGVYIVLKFVDADFIWCGRWEGGMMPRQIE